MLENTTILGKIIRIPLNLIPKGREIPFVQKSLRGKKWIVGSGPHGCWLGTAEREKRVLFEKSLLPGITVYDIGANVGYYSLMSSVGVGKSGIVYAFEPSPRNIDFFKKHMKLNKVSNVSLHEVALSDQDGSMYFIDDCDPVARRISSSGKIEVKTQTIDNFLKISEAKAPNLIKIDVEGAELNVLKGARETLIEHTPTLFVETHDCFTTGVHRDCIDFLEDIGYKVKVLEYNGEFGEIFADIKFSK